MHELKFEIKNESPLVFSSKFGDLNMVNTKSYIPGNTILGIIAHKVAQKRKLSKDMHKDDMFYNWFLSGNIIFSNAYIALNKQIFYPTPFSIQKEKYTNKIFDLLYLSDDSHPDTRYDDVKEFCYLPKDKKLFNEVDVKKEVNFHYTRDREKGIPDHNKIFNYESISAGQCFMGVIKGSESDLAQIIETCGKSWTGHAGRSKNAQYGSIRFSFTHESPQKIKSIPPQDRISLTLLSDTILLNKYGFSSTNKDDLKNYIPEVIIEKSFIKKDIIEGFSSKWRLKTPAAPCLKAGSTFLLNVSACDINILTHVHEKGLGERNHEGLGQCAFGWQSPTDSLTLQKKENNQIEKPDTVSDTVLIILQSLYKDHVLKEVQFKALEDQQKFVNDSSSTQPFSSKLPSNSLIAKLGAMAETLSPEDFIKNVQNLRPIAKNKLENCHNKKYTLYDFLLKPYIFVEEDKKLLNNLCSETSLDKDCFSIKSDELHRVYWQTFFSMMIKNRRDKKNEHKTS